ncbi:MAG: hypothetical protein CSA75_01650 [Sorangium cellulosum]|nr:MAG: hypothetical protein CSA75_01650 [Sorangium cellulosum]
MKSKSIVFLLAMVGMLSLVGVGCPCTDSVLNSSPWLRWQIFARFGASNVCSEMTKRGALLKVPVPVPGFPDAVGRFYPQTCQSSINEDKKTLSIWLAGNGYAWTPATQKMSFECSVAVEYKPDFHKDSDTIYVWFDVVDAPAPQFKIVHVEQAVTNVALQLYPVGWFASQMARSFVATQLAKGFTVIREDDQDDFSLGKLSVGQRPVHPWEVEGNERFTFANETTEIRGLQQDFLGPFEVDAKDRALYVKMQVNGPPIDVFVVTKDTGYAWRMQYQNTSPPSGPPRGGQILQIGQTPPNGIFEGWIRVPQGAYYVVLDNSTSAGMLNPPPKIPTPVDPSRAMTATVSYLVQMGDRP